MPFELFQKGCVTPGAPIGGPFVSIQKRGDFSISRLALEMIGSPAAVELLYDKAECLIAFRPAPPESRNAYRVRFNKSKVEYNSAAHVSGKSFLKYHGIAIPLKAEQYAPTVTPEGYLAIRIKDPALVAYDARVDELHRITSREKLAQIAQEAGASRDATKGKTTEQLRGLILHREFGVAHITPFRTA
jgi:hypothetical protein